MLASRKDLMGMAKSVDASRKKASMENEAVFEMNDSVVFDAEGSKLKRFDCDIAFVLRNVPGATPEQALRCLYEHIVQQIVLGGPDFYEVFINTAKAREV